MAEESVGLNITREDLAKLAEVNPLAWEQLLHIADMRIAYEALKASEMRVQELEGMLEGETSPSVNGVTANAE